VQKWHVRNFQKSQFPHTGAAVAIDENPVQNLASKKISKSQLFKGTIKP
jgi:hypothetical protein